MSSVDWTSMNEFLDRRLKELESKIDEIAATDTRERESIASRLETLMQRVLVAEIEIEDLKTFISEKGGGDDT